MLVYVYIPVNVNLFVILRQKFLNLAFITLQTVWDVYEKGQMNLRAYAKQK